MVKRTSHSRQITLFSLEDCLFHRYARKSVFSVVKVFSLVIYSDSFFISRLRLVKLQHEKVGISDWVLKILHGVAGD
jgi:uncharacterized membrane protein